MDLDKIIAWSLTAVSSLIAFLSWRSKAPIDRADYISKLGVSWGDLMERYEQRFKDMDAEIKESRGMIESLEAWKETAIKKIRDLENDGYRWKNYSARLIKQLRDVSPDTEPVPFETGDHKK